jgi:V/A-type H+/Na+-transporting ATPase subunit D
VERTAPTRSALLEQRAQLELAVRGRNLLERKRDQLMEAFREIADAVLTTQEAVEQAAVLARRSLAYAEAAHGAALVAGVASAGRSELAVTATPATIMGVRLVEIEAVEARRARIDRGSSLVSSSAAIDEAAARFETEVELLVELAARELRLRRLVEEIASTTRRVNALEFVVVPRLQTETASIQAVLDERERQDRFRLKRVKEQRYREELR